VLVVVDIGSPVKEVRMLRRFFSKGKPSHSNDDLARAERLEASHSPDLPPADVLANLSKARAELKATTTTVRQIPVLDFEEEDVTKNENITVVTGEESAVKETRNEDVTIITGEESAFKETRFFGLWAAELAAVEAQLTDLQKVNVS
jgi:hypothetical protein